MKINSNSLTYQTKTNKLQSTDSKPLVDTFSSNGNNLSNPVDMADKLKNMAVEGNEQKLTSGKDILKFSLLGGAMTGGATAALIGFIALSAAGPSPITSILKFGLLGGLTGTAIFGGAGLLLGAVDRGALDRLNDR